MRFVNWPTLYYYVALISSFPINGLFDRSYKRNDFQNMSDYHDWQVLISCATWPISLPYLILSEKVEIEKSKIKEKF